MSSLPQDIHDLVILLIFTENSHVLRQSLNEDLLHVNELEIIKRWVNFQFSKAGTKQRISNFTSDLQDSFLIVSLLSHLFPKLDLSAVSSENNPQARAYKLVQILSQTSLSAYLPSPRDIIQGNGIELIRFLVTLATQNPNLTDQNETIHSPLKSNFYGNNMNNFDHKTPPSSTSNNKLHTTDNVLSTIKKSQKYTRNLTNEMNPKEYDQQNFQKNENSNLNVNQNTFFVSDNNKYSEFGGQSNMTNYRNEEHHNFYYQKNHQEQEYNQVGRKNQYYHENKLNQEKNSNPNKNHHNLDYKQYQQQYQNREETRFQTPFNEQYQNQYQDHHLSQKNNHNFNPNENQTLKEEKIFKSQKNQLLAQNQKKRLLVQNQKNNINHRPQMGIQTQEHQIKNNYDQYQNQDYNKFNKNVNLINQKIESNQNFNNENKYHQDLKQYKNEKLNVNQLSNENQQFEQKLKQRQYPKEKKIETKNENENEINKEKQFEQKLNQRQYPQQNKNEIQNQFKEENRFEQKLNQRQYPKQTINKAQNVNYNQPQNYNRFKNDKNFSNRIPNPNEYSKQIDNNETNQKNKYNQNFHHEDQFQQNLNLYKNERQNYKQLFNEENQFQQNFNQGKYPKQNKIEPQTNIQNQINKYNQFIKPENDYPQNSKSNKNENNQNENENKNVIQNENEHLKQFEQKLKQRPYPKQNKNEIQNRINKENQFEQKLNQRQYPQQNKNEIQNQFKEKKQFEQKLNQRPYPKQNENKIQNQFNKENQFEQKLNQGQYPKQDQNQFQSQYQEDHLLQKNNNNFIPNEDQKFNKEKFFKNQNKQLLAQNQKNQLLVQNQNVQKIKYNPQAIKVKENLEQTQEHQIENNYKQYQNQDYDKFNKNEPQIDQKLESNQNFNYGNKYHQDLNQYKNTPQNVNQLNNENQQFQQKIERRQYSKQNQNQLNFNGSNKENQFEQKLNQKQYPQQKKNEIQNENEHEKQFQQKLNQRQYPQQNKNEIQNQFKEENQFEQKLNQRQYPQQNKNEIQSKFNEENQYQQKLNPRQYPKQTINKNQNVNDNQPQNYNRFKNDKNFSNRIPNPNEYSKQIDNNETNQKNKYNQNFHHEDQFQQNLNLYKNERQNYKQLFNEENQFQQNFNQGKYPKQNKIEPQTNIQNQINKYNQFIKPENDYPQNSKSNKNENNQNGNENENNKQYHPQYPKQIEERQFRNQINNYQYSEQNFNQSQIRNRNHNHNYNNYKHDNNIYNNYSQNNHTNNYNNINNINNDNNNNDNNDNNNSNSSHNINQSKKEQMGEVEKKEFQLDEVEIKKFEELLDENERITELIEESEETISEFQKLLESELIEYSNLQKMNTTKTNHDMKTNINLSSFAKEIDIIADLFTLIKEKIIHLTKILPNSFDLDSHLLLKGMLQMLKNGISNIHTSSKKSEEILFESLLEILKQNNVTTVNESMAHSFKFQIFTVGPLDLQGIMDSLQFILDKLRVKKILKFGTDDIENSIRTLFNSFLFAKSFKIKLSSVIVKDLLLPKGLINIEESSINSLKDDILDLLNVFVLAFVDFNQLNRGIKSFVKAFNLASINKKSSEKLIATAKRSALGETIRYILINILTDEESNLVSQALKSYSRITFNYESSQIVYLRGTQWMESILYLSDILFLGAAIDPNNCRSSISKIANSLYNLSEYVGFTLPLLKMAISQQIQRTASAGTLFRANDVTTKMITRYVFIHGSDYINLILKKPINEFILLNLDLEVNPQKISSMTTKKTQKIKNGMKHLKFWFNKFCDIVFDSMSHVPIGFRVVANCLKNEISKKFPDNVISGIGGFFFLRFICPIIVDPTRFGLIKGNPNPIIARGLLLITTIIQALSNGISITSSNREYMFPINKDIIKHFQIRRSFLLEMAKIPKSEKENYLKRSLFETCTKTNFYFIKDVFIPVILKNISQKEALPKKEFSQVLYHLVQSVTGDKSGQGKGKGKGKEILSSYEFYTQNQLLRINRSEEKISNISKLSSIFEKIIITVEGFYPRLDKEAKALNRHRGNFNNTFQKVNYKEEYGNNYNYDVNRNNDVNSNSGSNNNNNNNNENIENDVNVNLKIVETNQSKHFKNNESVEQTNTTFPLIIQFNNLNEIAPIKVSVLSFSPHSMKNNTSKPKWQNVKIILKQSLLAILYYPYRKIDRVIRICGTTRMSTSDTLIGKKNSFKIKVEGVEALLFFICPNVEDRDDWLEKLRTARQINFLLY
ncbi:ras gtpase-activating protein [Anaeramoeba flamelloides]|uniref:Ras gtpase-activating protein n=1 Tax=Anaeramoeba flamelloides TaxID=1746091 RepID=A0ABQ8Y0U5_9EUKA|nr:ras gtpase-activating protein [Anaeramoeba flamelloides]